MFVLRNCVTGWGGGTSGTGGSAPVQLDLPHLLSLQIGDDQCHHCRDYDSRKCDPSCERHAREYISSGKEAPRPGAQIFNYWVPGAGAY